MRIDILTLFPHMFDGFLTESIIKRAIEKEKVKIKEQKIEDNSNNLDQTNKLMDDSSLNESSKYILNSLNKSNKDFQKRSTVNKRTSLFDLFNEFKIYLF